MRASLWIILFFIAGCTVIWIDGSTDTDIDVMTGNDAKPELFK